MTKMHINLLAHSVWTIIGTLVISKHSSCLCLNSKHIEGSKYAKYIFLAPQILTELKFNKNLPNDLASLSLLFTMGDNLCCQISLPSSQLYLSFG